MIGYMRLYCSQALFFMNNHRKQNFMNLSEVINLAYQTKQAGKQTLSPCKMSVCSIQANMAKYAMGKF